MKGLSKITNLNRISASSNSSPVAVHVRHVCVVTFLMSTEGKYHMLPSGELLIRHVDDEDKYRSYQCRALNRLTGATLLSSGRAKFSVSGKHLPVCSQQLNLVRRL
jgi:hypothetical protein